MSTKSFREGICHTTAEDEVVYLCKEVLDDTNLSRYLRTTHNSCERTLDVAEDSINSLYLFLHEVAKHLVVLVEVLVDNSCRSVLAVSSTKGVHYVAVGIRSELLGKLLLTSLHLLLCSVELRCALFYANWLAFLFWVEAEVLKKQSLARLQSSCLLRSVAAILGKLNLNTESCRNVRNNLAQRKLHVYLALWLAHVRHHNESAAISKYLLQCRKGTADTGIVCYISVLVQWYVEVNAYNSLLTGKVEIFDFHFCKCYFKS